MIPYSTQDINDADVRAVIKTLRSGWLTQGPGVEQFEAALAKAAGTKYAVALNSGTAALHAAYFAAGVKKGDEVIVPALTFAATGNAALYLGAKPVFADIDPRTYNISPREVEKKINERTKALIPVHFAGQSSDTEVIRGIVRTSEKKYGHKIYVVEDACHALGSRYKKTKVGSCVYSDMAVLSFHPVKHITTAEGGAVLTNDKELQRKLGCFRTHGITANPEEFFSKENGFENGGPGEPIRKKWYYEQNYLGYNYRMTDIQAALGISQLKKITRFLQRRREIVNCYNAAFKNIEWLTIPFEENLNESNFHLYVLQFDFKKIGMSRVQVMAELAKKMIQTQVHYIPVYTQPFYRKTFGTNWGDCPVAEQYYQKCLSIPLYPSMGNKNVEKVIAGIRGLAE